MKPTSLTSRGSKLLGERFGKLVVVEFVGSTVAGRSNGKQRFWECECDCGNKTIVPTNRLTMGTTKSCGCLVFTAKKTHGKSHSAEYRSWGHMLSRCYNPKSTAYPYYGGRGISVCDSWRESFENFYKDMGPRPKGFTIERKDNSMNYEPRNCVWASRKQQQNNTRWNRIIEFDGKRLNVTQWSSLLGFKKGLIDTRIRLGWTIEKTLTTQPEYRKPRHG